MSQNDYRVYHGSLIAVVEDVAYQVEIINKWNKPQYDSRHVYLIGEYLYPYRGVVENKIEAKNIGVGIYSCNGRIFMIDPKTDEEKNMFSEDNIVELNPDMIYKTIKENSDNYISEEELEAINNSTDIYRPIIRPEDDILKKAAKLIILEKRINPKNYENKTESKWEMSNLKTALNKSANLTFKNFLKILEICGCDFQITISDNGTDRIRPLKKPITLTLSEEKYSKVEEGGEE